MAPWKWMAATPRLASRSAADRSSLMAVTVSTRPPLVTTLPSFRAVPAWNTSSPSCLAFASPVGGVKNSSCWLECSQWREIEHFVPENHSQSQADPAGKWESICKKRPMEERQVHLSAQGCGKRHLTDTHLIPAGFLCLSDTQSTKHQHYSDPRALIRSTWLQQVLNINAVPVSNNNSVEDWKYTLTNWDVWKFSCSCWPRTRVSTNLSSSDHLPAAGENRERPGGERAFPALFTCYFQALGICPWIALAGHDHSHSCTVLLPGWHGAGQPPVEHCLHNLVQVTLQQGQDHLQKHTAANQRSYFCIVFPWPWKGTNAAVKTASNMSTYCTFTHYTCTV